MTTPIHVLAENLEWATDQNYDAGTDPWSGTPTKVDPTTQTKTKGFTPETPASAQQTNYLLNVAAQISKHVLSMTELLPVLNFSQRIGSIGTLVGLGYSEAERRWFALGSSNNLRTSVTQGWTWDVETPGSADGSESWHNIAFDDSGNGVAVGFRVNINSHPSATYYNAGIATWGVPVALDVTTNIDGLADVVWDRISGLWCAIFRLDTFVCKVFTSPDGATWTSRTPPTNFSSGTSTYRLATNGLGRIVATAVNGTGSIFIGTSDNGGVNWTNQTTLTTVITEAPFTARPVYSAAMAKWVMSVTDTTAVPQSEIWDSTDGAIWTKIATIPKGIFGLATLGQVWAGIAYHSSTYHVVYSLDGGITWLFSHFRPGGLPLGVRASSLGFMVITDTGVYPGLLCGTGVAL